MKHKLLYVIVVTVIAFTACNTEKKPTQKFIETGYMDSSIKPGDNFFMFVNGKWIDTAKIPPTESGIGAFLDVYNKQKIVCMIFLTAFQKEVLKREA